MEMGVFSNEDVLLFTLMPEVSKIQASESNVPAGELAVKRGPLILVSSIPPNVNSA